MALIDNDDCIKGITDDRCAIIVFVTVPAQLLVHNCPVDIYPKFSEWWSTSSMKVTHVDGILFPAFVINMAKVVFHLNDLYADIRQIENFT